MSSASPFADPPAAPRTDRPFLRFAAFAAFAGFLLQFGASAFHPGQVQPNETAAVFREYAAADGWTLVHLGQFGGGLLVAIALIVLARSLPVRGLAGVLALVGGVAAAAWAVVFAVQMAVDGVALRTAIDNWAQAPATDQAAALFAADAVRALEKGLSAMFHLLNGTSLVALGGAVALGRVFPRWLGWFGVAAGLGYLGGGIATALGGFSPLSGQILGVALIPGVVFLFGIAIAMWRTDPTPRGSAVIPALAAIPGVSLASATAAADLAAATS